MFFNIIYNALVFIFACFVISLVLFELWSALKMRKNQEIVSLDKLYDDNRQQVRFKRFLTPNTVSKLNSIGMSQS